MAKRPVLREEGPWRVHCERVAYRNPWIRVVEHEVTHPDGSPGQYGVVEFANLAVGVLPLNEEGETVLVGQHRFALSRYSWELPEGGGDPDTPPEETAARELAEETGCRASHFEPFLDVFTSNSVTNERAVGFIATGLTSGHAAPDPTEVLETRWLPFGELLDLVMRGEITDAFTVMMVLQAYAKVEAGQLPRHISHLIRKGGPK